MISCSEQRLRRSETGIREEEGGGLKEMSALHELRRIIDQREKGAGWHLTNPFGSDKACHQQATHDLIEVIFRTGNA
jgi:hypothetical protein